MSKLFFNPNKQDTIFHYFKWNLEIKYFKFCRLFFFVQLEFSPIRIDQNSLDIFEPPNDQILFLACFVQKLRVLKFKIKVFNGRQVQDHRSNLQLQDLINSVYCICCDLLWRFYLISYSFGFWLFRLFYRLFLLKAQNGLSWSFRLFYRIIGR